MTAFDDLLAFERETLAVSRVAERQFWDQETMMPEGATEQRAEEHAAMAKLLHARRTDPRIGEWLAASEPQSDTDRACLRLVRRDYERHGKLPEELVAEIARTTSLAHRVWVDARANEDVAAFLPMLEKVVDLRIQEGEALCSDGSPYNALLNDYEPDACSEDIASLFDEMRPRLVALRGDILDHPPAPQLVGHFDKGAQLALSKQIAQTFGYDFARGRMDMAVHPFCSGSGNDVRITTRTDAGDPFNCIYSSIHETGHACYEQNVDPAYHLTPLEGGVSMGVHESQSRIFENQLGRSEGFSAWLFSEMRAAFGDFGIENAWDFYRAVNRVDRGFIRTEADELQYNLHIMLRFDLERALISRDLKPTDLEAAWNDRFEADFGYAVDRPSNGLLQDVHWSEGLFGYFPTYALGNVYAGCLFESLGKAHPNLSTDLAAGQLTAATGWLRDTLQRHGRRFTPVETIERAIGGPISAEPLLTYLEDKFRILYGL